MIEIPEGDTVPIDAFPLAWRFTTRRAERWPSELLARLRPLNATAAAALGRRAADARGEGNTFDVTFRSDDAPADVRQRLRDLPPAPTEHVLVSWDAQTALITDWELFVASWDDFCYPASDDVTVLPLTGDWVLYYRRYEVMQFRAHHP